VIQIILDSLDGTVSKIHLWIDGGYMSLTIYGKIITYGKTDQK
jgi:hypothetical protein